MKRIKAIIFRLALYCFIGFILFQFYKYKTYFVYMADSVIQGNLKFEISAERSKFNSGEDITFFYKITNTRYNTFAVFFNKSEINFFGIKILDSRGNSLTGSRDYFHPGSAAFSFGNLVILKPDESLKGEILLSDFLPVTLLDMRNKIPRIPRGIFTITMNYSSRSAEAEGPVDKIMIEKFLRESPVKTESAITSNALRIEIQ